MKTDLVLVESGNVVSVFEEASNMAARKRELTKPMSMRLSPEDKRALDDVAKRVPVIPRLTIARLAMRAGLELFLEDPSLLLGGDRPATGSRSSKAKRRRGTG